MCRSNSIMTIGKPFEANESPRKWIIFRLIDCYFILFYFFFSLNSQKKWNEMPTLVENGALVLATAIKWNSFTSSEPLELNQLLWEKQTDRGRGVGVFVVNFKWNITKTISFKTFFKFFDKIYGSSLVANQPWANNSFFLRNNNHSNGIEGACEKQTFKSW